MSFRLRVFLLVATVAVTSTAATTWLALRQASSQLTRTVTADQQALATIVDSLAAYGRSHNTWDGVQAAVAELSRSTGQRILLTTETGAPVADSDLVEGVVPRPAPAPALVIDPRVAPRIPAGTDPQLAATQLLRDIETYREAARYASCLTAAGVPIVATAADGQLVLEVLDKQRPELADCQSGPPTDALTQATDERMLGTCLRFSAAAAIDCLQRVYTQVIAGFTPPPLRLQVGAVDTVRAGVDAAPVALAAGVAIVVLLVGAWLLSRRVLRPIRAVTAASARLGAGDLGQRVPVSGGDELATLARAFNRMADSLGASEERQRRLVADVAHELRTPLSNLRGYLEALQDGVIAPDSALLRSLHEEVLLQQRIVDDLQDLALAEAGELTYERGPVDLADVARQCVMAQAAAAHTASVHLRMEAVPTQAVVVPGDAGRLRQAVGNLVANAIRATPPGGMVTLSIVDQPRAAVVRVSDTGVGISPANLPHVFDRFWRADTARSRAKGGAGLGLPIARQIVLDHGGRIDAASVPGRGSTFTLRLPR